ncbi:serine hydrolase [Alteriqipengyuania lutimaris]|uniref:serine hydrolase n=1 Tax=Alteriqipengyuania lutimaris TaxID=1538146 RepID=UPI0017B0EA6C|nr:serine hydrolase [Alteriqipengyuania lutimaris]MBB3032438.1 CubicO group peptidase (beta-lactamase class C family) [Alteriqipengyuania lutimaris]
MATPAAAEPPANLEQRADALLDRFEAPGLSIAIVENGEVTFADGFGVTDLEDPVAVGPDTNFAIGSVTKAFTSTALAILVDEGRIGWDQKVVDIMPEFRMKDAWVTREMTVRDLLVHRSGLGLGAGDLLFVPRSDLTRADIVERLGEIPLETSFRSSYAYDNILYMVAGRLIERVTDQNWERFVTDRILRPAGMTRATVENNARGPDDLVADSHARIDGPIRGMGTMERLDESLVVAQVAAPAGGIAASANDMAKWIELQLALGDLPGDARLFSEEQAREMWEPVVLKPTPIYAGALSETAPMFNTYALGWDVRDYRGERVVMHGGGVYGSITRLVLLPDRNVGFFLATNSEEAGLLTGLQFELLDHYLGVEGNDWPAAFGDFIDNYFASAAQQLAAPGKEPADVGPSLPLAGYAGDYADPWFGKITVNAGDEGLRVAFPHWEGVTARLEHWQYDTFITRYEDESFEPAYVTFSLDAEGAVDRITMEAVSPVADFSWDYHDLEFHPVAAGAQ